MTKPDATAPGELTRATPDFYYRIRCAVPADLTAPCDQDDEPFMLAGPDTPFRGLWDDVPPAA